MKVISGSQTLTDHISGAPFNPAPLGMRFEVFLNLSSRPAFACGQAIALFYDGRLLHSSDANRTDQPRVATSTILIPQEASVRLYVWDKAAPDQLAVLELTDEFFARSADLSKPISPPYSDHVRYIGSVGHRMRPLQLAQIKQLLRDNKSNGFRFPSYKSLKWW